MYSNAATWSGTFWQVGAIAGPGVAGFLYAYLGLINTLWVVVVILAITQAMLLLISKKPIPQVAEEETVSLWPVSYTHLDVYKRQGLANQGKPKMFYHSLWEH